MAELVTLAWVAARYGYKVKALRDMALKGRLPGACKAGAEWRVNVVTLRAAWEKNSTPVNALKRP